jgi:hypothetical protein
MADKILQAFLGQQFEDGMAMAADSDILSLQAIDGAPPQRYIATFRAKGLVKDERGRVVEADGCAVGIWLPDDYLRQAEAAQVLTYLGPPRPWHPNIRPPFICIHLRPGMPLVDLLHACYEVWTWNMVSTRDEGLNHAASQWTRKQDPDRFPIDRRPIKRRKLAIAVSPACPNDAAARRGGDRRSPASALEGAKSGS